MKNYDIIVVFVELWTCRIFRSSL